MLVKSNDFESSLSFDLQSLLCLAPVKITFTPDRYNYFLYPLENKKS